MAKNILILSLLFTSFSIFSQSQTSLNDDVFPNSNKEILKRFAPRVSFETLNLDEVVDKSGVNSRELGRVNMNGFNLGFSFETYLGKNFTTYTIPSISYVYANDSTTADLDEDYNMYNFSYKINQTLNYNIQYKSALIQPFIGVGIGHGSQNYDFKKRDGSAFNDQSYKGAILEGNIGVQALIKRWTPFIQATFRKQSISNIKRNYSYQDNQDFDVEGVSYRGESILIGTGYSL